jgi:hypothetical protein
MHGRGPKEDDVTQLPATEAHLVVRQRQAERRQRSEIQQLVTGASGEDQGTVPSDLVGRLLGRPAHAHPVPIPARPQLGLVLEPEA